jgi:hypothetical protein
MKLIFCILSLLSFGAFLSCSHSPDKEVIVRDTTFENVEMDSGWEEPPSEQDNRLSKQQQDTTVLELSDGVVLFGVIQKFDKNNHTIDTCTDELRQKYICKIDGKPWYGMDRGLESPKTQLTDLRLVINGLTIPLDVSGMFNPRFSYQLIRKQFNLKKNGGEYELSGFFSDGAGTYEATWKINTGKSVRTSIANAGY